MDGELVGILRVGLDLEGLLERLRSLKRSKMGSLMKLTKVLLQCFVLLLLLEAWLPRFSTGQQGLDPGSDEVSLLGYFFVWRMVVGRFQPLIFCVVVLKGCMFLRKGKVEVDTRCVYADVVRGMYR
ncbi:hypothetical protein B0T17DRAFT_545163 [Bombardia bombarda]|uniref:Uncharacterized protein n=1 Tax=Bombardia bombarda TaxID=252184 RepID=A0AA39W9V8_9PEZI|nr:hypothetical protein B0T17DRAFT_545163 [Bombardia bombarda]